jgi:UDP-N-acetylglucosamine--N-acetylmuramyl-(pentapeptide) pyrophosphoryl-undecaprenol N-acetylglucosamine transferase
VVGGSQGAIAINQLIRQCAPAWFDAGIWLVHLTGDADPDAQSFHHPQYQQLPFFDSMAALFQRADLVISRAGSGSLTELAVTKTPAILIPYPYAAEDHQAYNAEKFAQAGAALVFRQSDLTPPLLQGQVLELIKSPEKLATMGKAMQNLAIVDSAERLAVILQQLISTNN